ncbi:MAG: 2'-5' RNA ligase family protein [Taibaiella sp.]|nr:2'-5' RNA ligase family protein [Taibaiella sp.]
MVQITESQIETYSVVIHPPDEVISAVAALKQSLEQKIGWYHSVHSLAHITFNIFKARVSAISQWEAYLSDFSSNHSPIPLHFDRTESFSNGSFVLLANEPTNLLLKETMRDFNNNRPKGAVKKSQRPHLTIARKLSAEQMAIATELIANVNIHFTLDRLVLRKLNLARGQYDIIATFPFNCQRSTL